MEYADAINLLAGIVEQARKDAAGKTGRTSKARRCPIDYPHSSKGCAIQFLGALDTRMKDSPKHMTIMELAQTVLEVIES